MRNKLSAFIFTIALTIGMSAPAYGAVLEKTAPLPKDYAAAKFTLEFEKEGEYSVVITDPEKKSSYEATQTSKKEAICIIQNVRQGDWNVRIETDDPEPVVTYDDEGNPVEQEMSVPAEEVIGKVSIKVEGSNQEIVDVTKPIAIAEDIAGLRMYFRDETSDLPSLTSAANGSHR